MANRRVVLVDDSPTSRTLLRAVIDADPALDVVGEATNGADALELVRRLLPSIVIMDINMPGMDGFETTKRIMIEQPTPIIIVTSSIDPLEVEVGLKAVGAGALTAVPKPPAPTSPRHAAEAARLVRLVKALADVKVIRHRRGTTPTAPVSPPSPRLVTGALRGRTVEVVGVAASTGGPAALYGFLQSLPRSLDIPVLVVQHISVGFIDGLARWLSSATLLPVLVATEGTRLRGGEVYLAPDDRHLTVAAGRIVLSSAAPIGGFRPSATALFGSLARSYGAGSAAVVLTGMGEDGLVGASQVHDAGGLVLAQDAVSAVVFGMPRAVIDASIASIVGPVDELARRIAGLAPRKELKT